MPVFARYRLTYRDGHRIDGRTCRGNHSLDDILYFGWTACGRRYAAIRVRVNNYTALGYGDFVPAGWRLIGPVTALNGLLLIGWSVAIIFEVLRMAELHVGHRHKRTD